MRPALAVTTALLLLLGTGAAEAASSARLAETAGFLLGNAHRCGIAGDRVVRAGQLIRDLIVAAAEDGREEEDATARFVRFFVVSAVADPAAAKAVASCQKVGKEFDRLERHPVVGNDPDSVATGSTGAPFRLSDGE